MGYSGFYINLDRNPERRASMESELARCNLSHYRRFKAANGNILGLANPHLKNAEMGCFQSHYLLLKENLSSDKHLHVIEDDILLSPHTATALNWLIENKHTDQYDIVYTDISIPLLNDAYQVYKKIYDSSIARDASGAVTGARFNVLDLKQLTFGSTCSFLVSNTSIKKLHDLYERELQSEPALPIDIFICRKMHEGVLRLGCLFPFVTSIRLDDILKTNIHSPHTLPRALAASIGRYSFFIGRDLEHCQEYIRKHLPAPPNDPHLSVLTQLLTFSLTNAPVAP